MIRKSSLSCVVAMALLGGFVAAARADSARVVQVDGHGDFTFVNTTTCSFPVTVNGSANYRRMFFFDEGGSLVRSMEIAVGPWSVIYSANGRTLEGGATGGFEFSWNPDGTRTLSWFGINALVTIPGYGVVVLDAGRRDVQTWPYFELLLWGGPNEYDRDAFCGALS